MYECRVGGLPVGKSKTWFSLLHDLFFGTITWASAELVVQERTRKEKCCGLDNDLFPACSCVGCLVFR